MSPPELWPPLEWIDEQLPVQKVAVGGVMAETVEVGAAPPASTIALPPDIAALIDRRLAAQAALRTQPLAPGVIVSTLFDALGGRHTQMLLTRELQGLWSGYLVAAETDYASCWDVLLVPDDEPFDPDAALVQAWNPLQLRLGAEIRILAKLGTARLASIEAVAREYRQQVSLDLAPQPGRVYPRRTRDGHPVLTGTPVGGVNDPRRLYQSLYTGYARAAEAASGQLARAQPATATPEQDKAKAQDARFGDFGFAIARRGGRGEPVGHVGNGLAWRRWGILALSMAVLLAWFLPDQFLGTPEKPVTELTRGVLPRPASADFRVVISPAAEFGAVVALLQKHGCRIVAGPSASGELWLALEPTADREDTRQQLRASPLIDDVAPLDPPLPGGK